jgi:signal transduction histidine kinase
MRHERAAHRRGVWRTGVTRMVVFPNTQTIEGPSRGRDEQTLDAFASRVGHQLGEASALLRASTAAPAGDKAAEQALAAATERVTIVAFDLMEVTSTAAAALEPTVVDLAAALEAALEMLGPSADIADVRLPDAELPAVRADPDLLDRLLRHLLRQAIAAAGGGHVEVEVEEMPQDVRITVRDDGETLSPEAAPLAFEPFAPARGYGPLLGAGISLFLCRRIAERHHGTAVARPGSGGAGAEVTVVLPL